MLERFTQKIAEPFDVHNDCWLWTACKNRRGYGEFQFNGKRTHAHRVAYQLFVGPIPEGYHVDHMCKNKACVRPDHLQVLTHFESTRQAQGDKTHCPRGHEYSEINTYRHRDGSRQCKTCHIEWERIYRGRRHGILEEA